MTYRKSIALLWTTAFICGHAYTPARADNGSALNEINSTAERLCGSVTPSGRSNNVQVTGEVKAELSGLAKKFAGLGISGTGALITNEYEGVLQQELATALRDVRTCKMEIFNTLQKKLIPDTPPTRNPNALYQYNEAVAEVQGAAASQANGTITFQFVRTTGKADPTREVEYQDWVLSCPDLPRPKPNEFVGQFMGVLAGEVCRIIRKRT